MRRQLFGLVTLVAMTFAATSALAQGRLGGDRNFRIPKETEEQRAFNLSDHARRLGGAAATATFYTDRDDLVNDPDCDISVTLDFEDANIGAGDITAAPAPNSWSTGSIPGAFPGTPGSNNPSVDFTADPYELGNEDLQGMLWVGAGLFGVTSNVMGNNTASDDPAVDRKLVTEFNCEGSTCFGANIGNLLGNSNIFIEVFDSAGNSVDSTNVLGTPAALGYFGVKISDGSLGRIEMQSTDAGSGIPASTLGFEFMDNIDIDECLELPGSALEGVNEAIEAIEAKLDMQDPCDLVPLVLPLLGLEEAPDDLPCP